MTTPRTDAQIQTLPDNLPVPTDDGACDHLKQPGFVLPAGVALPATDGRSVDVAALPGLHVVYFYPMTGRPGTDLPGGWNDIPGARGCTPEACAFRDHHAELRALGVREVFGVSTQTTDYQEEAVERLHLPFAMLSDASLQLARALRLPTFEADGATLVKRVTLVVRDGRVEHCWYPVFPTDLHAGEVAKWLASAGQRQRG